MIFRSSTNDDLRVLISWIKDKDACKLWAGPDVRFPLVLAHLKEDINFSEENTFSMINDNGALLGIGQLIKKEKCQIHMARIIVSPIQRSKGFGSLLCRFLISEVNFSLNVYSHNTKAVRLYKKLGFKPRPVSPDSRGDEKSMHMILKPGRANKAKPPAPLRKGDSCHRYM
jgi:ribosomal protein S18 acetylase RimI-like enzyme